MTYELHDGPNDYGLRRGTIALGLHMTEGNGGAGDLAYLLRNPARGVSANYFAQDDGSIHQLLPMSHASGSFNPKDRSTDKGYYGASTLKAVLGDHWPDPNAWAISIEIGGKAAKGPNARQVKAVVAWGLDMRKRYPTIVGAFGHADQTNTKGCPGNSAAIKSIFAGIGGHGVFTATEEPMRSFNFGDDTQMGTVVVNGPNHNYLTLASNVLSGRVDPVKFGRHRAFGPVKLLGGGIGGPKDTRVDGYVIGGNAVFMISADVVFTPDPVPVPDCSLIEHELATANARIVQAVTALGGTI